MISTSIGSTSAPLHTHSLQPLPLQAAQVCSRLAFKLASLTKNPAEDTFIPSLRRIKASSAGLAKAKPAVYKVQNSVLAFTRQTRILYHTIGSMSNTMGRIIRFVSV
jgi:hypothetical protein